MSEEQDRHVAGESRPRPTTDVPAEDAASDRDRALAAMMGKRMYGTVGLLFLAALIFRFLEPISRVLLIAFIGIIVAMAFNALVSRIPLRRGLATAIVAIGTLALIGGGSYLAVNALIPQVREFAEDLPAIQSTVEGWEERLREETGFELELVGETVEAVLADPFSMAMMLLSQAAGVLEIVGLSVLVLFGALFVVAKPNDMLLNPMLRAVPRHRRPAFRRAMTRLAERLVGWLRGTVLSMIIIGILSGLAFWVLGAPYALLLGVFVGIVEIIPIVGPWIGGGLAVLVTAFYDPATALWIAVAVLVIQQIEGNVVRPFVMAGSAELHPFVTLIALLLFGAMFGFLGALLALPLVIAIGTVVEVFWVEETIETDEDEIEPMVET
jgi:predicted PurR-regulated permease PerM